MIELYRQACERYNWPVDTVDDLRIAPFHLLATEGSVHNHRDHEWHMEVLTAITDQEPILTRTPWRSVDVENEREATEAADWWRERTDAGSEGMVVKPLGLHGIRPDASSFRRAMKCRGPEHLRIIYGPEYTTENNLARLRRRSEKTARAIQEYALGIQALETFVGRGSTEIVLRAVPGVLALEAEPIDPRL